MHEFNNRMIAQRLVLLAVNKKNYNEELFGLSSAAIKRWMENNQLHSTSRIVELVTTISKKLLFLASKSQEQVSPEYRNISIEISTIVEAISSEGE